MSKEVVINHDGTDGVDGVDGVDGRDGRDGRDGSDISIRVPLEQWVREIVQETVWQVVKEAMPEHVKGCEAIRLVSTIKENSKKVDELRMRFATLIGFMVGSGALGGVAGAIVSKLLGA